MVRLGADHLAERDEASAALMSLGWKARDEVHNALDSPDAEVQWRAQELWKTLRWTVMPDADADTRALIEESEQKKSSREHWRDFVKKHGAESIRLVAEFYANKLQGYDSAVYAILEDANPEEVAQVIARSGEERPALEKPIDELTPDRAATNTAINLMEIEIALWHYRKAFDFGRDVWMRSGMPSLQKECAVAMNRGNLFDQVNEEALKATSPRKPDNSAAFVQEARFLHRGLCRKRASDGTHLAALCDAATNLNTTQLHGIELQQLIESFLRAGLPANAIKALRHPQNPLEMYLLSLAHFQMNEAEAAAADWKMVMAALDPANKATKAQLFSLGELMRHWRDQRAGLVFQKIIDLTPPEPIYDANAYFRLGELAEQQRQYRQAADFMEKGLALARGLGGIIVVTGGKGEVTNRGGKRAGVDQATLQGAGCGGRRGRSPAGIMTK